MKKYLPQNTTITTGFVQTHNGISNQSDIILYDANNFVPIFSGYANQIIPLNALKMVIECTMYLDKTKLESDNEKAGNLKKLYENNEMVHDSFVKKPMAVLFAYKSSGDTLAYLNQLENKNFDMVFCADGKLYVYNETECKYSNNMVENIFSGNTQHGYEFKKEQHAFVIFYSMLVDNLLAITNQQGNYSLVQQYSMSSIYVDYDK